MVKWQKDDNAYNYIYDFLASFYAFDFDEVLQNSLNESRRFIATEFSAAELYEILLQSATEVNKKRFLEPDVKKKFITKVNSWTKIMQVDTNYKENEEEF